MLSQSGPWQTSLIDPSLLSLKSLMAVSSTVLLCKTCRQPGPIKGC